MTHVSKVYIRDISLINSTYICGIYILANFAIRGQKMHYQIACAIYFYKNTE
jgi:hypothetical protein